MALTKPSPLVLLLVILSRAKDLKACVSLEVCADREILHYVQNDAYRVFAFNIVILSRAKDLWDSTAVNDSTNVITSREILHYVQNDVVERRSE